MSGGRHDPAGVAAEDASDERLVTAVLRRRDEAAFRALYRRHTPILYRYCLGRVRRPDAAEAAVQETWLRAARSLGRFDARSTLRSWLVGIARNCCREHLRHEARLRRVPESVAVPADRQTATGARIDLQRAVSGLPERARTVLLLHDVEGCTHAEIGGVLGIDPGTSKSQLSRARRLLRDALSGGDER